MTLRLYSINKGDQWPDSQYEFFVIASNLEEAVTIFKQQSGLQYNYELQSNGILHCTTAEDMYIDDMGKIRKGGFNPFVSHPFTIIPFQSGTDSDGTDSDGTDGDSA